MRHTFPAKKNTAMAPATARRMLLTLIHLALVASPSTVPNSTSSELAHVDRELPARIGRQAERTRSALQSCGKLTGLDHVGMAAPGGPATLLLGWPSGVTE